MRNRSLKNSYMGYALVIAVFSAASSIVIMLLETTVMKIGGAAIFIGLLLFLMMRMRDYFLNPLNKIIEVLDAVCQGDLSKAEALDVGHKVNCSSIKSCKTKGCPSFGIDDACWVTSGSMAVVKSCPRALKGIDCRSCNLYGAKNEYHEIGSQIRALINYLLNRSDVMKELATGNLNVDMKIAAQGDQLGHSMKEMIETINDIVTDIRQSSVILDRYASGVSNASQNISSAVTEEAATIEQLNAALELITSNSGEHSTNALDIVTIAQKAYSHAEEGNREIKEMTEKMDEMKDSSAQVVNVVKVIEDIAFQTNLLALNASVEAARAGTSGKGFAVVADEVRTLAARSSKAAQETAALIGRNNESITSGVAMAVSTGERFKTIVAEVQNLKDHVDEIKRGATTQTSSISEMQHAMTQLSSTIQENSASSEEAAAESIEMRSLAKKLNELTAFFSTCYEVEQITEEVNEGAIIAS